MARVSPCWISSPRRPKPSPQRWGGVAITADVTARDGCDRAVAETVAAFGGLDLLVNNAAPGRDRSLIGQLEGRDWQAHAELVLCAVTMLTEAALVHLAARPGAIVNVSSVTAQAIMARFCTWPYHVSKAGLEQLTRYLACRLGEDGIRVNAVAPSLVDRSVGRKLSDDPEAAAVVRATVPLRRAGTAMDIGEAVAFLGSDRASYITGQVLAVDGGIGCRDVFDAGMSARAGA